MRIKTDENMARSGIEFLRALGHDVATVQEQGLAGSRDEALFRICVAERRILITLDRDFGQIPRFPPRQSAGVVILDIGEPAALSALLERLRAFVSLAAAESVDGRLWIVEAARVRVHLEDDDD